MKTYSAKPADVKRKWYIIDASGAPLGRTSTGIVGLLTGKTKAIYTPHIDCGDYVVLINSDKIRVTGSKMIDKKYYRHSGYPGNLKVLSLKDVIDKDSTKVVELAVKRMLPANKLLSERMKRLKVYKDSEHNHQPQQPIEYNIRKDSR